MQLRFDPAARAEYVGAVARYKAESVDRAREFAEEFRSAVDAILAFRRAMQPTWTACARRCFTASPTC